MGLFDMAKAMHPDSKLFGFLAGPHGIYSNNYTEITPEFMSEYRNMGGFDMISKCKKLNEELAQFMEKAGRKMRLFTPYETLGYLPSNHDEICPWIKFYDYFDNIT